MRALGPLPLTLERSIPSVRAKARTDGDACAPRNASSSTGAAGLAVGAGSAAAAAADDGAAETAADGAAEGAATGASVFAPAAPPAAAVVSRVRMTLPSLTLSPTLTLRSLTVPALGAGTSMVALSDSSVTSESSAFTASPGLTKTSMTGTSLKSPMSGTLTSIVLMETSEAHPRRRKVDQGRPSRLLSRSLTPLANLRWKCCRFASDGPRRRLRRVDAVFLYRLGD